MRKEKVCIVGSASSSRDQVPFEDDSFEFWGMNNLFMLSPEVCSKWDRWFEMHDLEEIESYYLTHWVAYKKFMEDFNGPVYCQQETDIFPTATAYPFDEVEEEGKRYFCSTSAYQLALAVHYNFKEIHIFGIDMVIDEEFDYQRPNMEYWIGVAEGKGIRVVIPSQSALLSSHGLYGFKNDMTDYALKQRALKERRGQLLSQKEKMEAERLDIICQTHQLQGREDALKEAIKFLSPMPNEKEALNSKLAEFVEERENLSRRNDELLGAIFACGGSLKENSYQMQVCRQELRGSFPLIGDELTPEEVKTMDEEMREEAPDAPVVDRV